MSTTADLPDLNVWLALAWPAHSHHQHAVQYWEQQAAEEVLFCTVTALGLVSLVCQPKLMGTAVRNAAEASGLLDSMCRQPGVRLAAPEHNGWELFQQGILRRIPADRGPQAADPRNPARHAPPPGPAPHPAHRTGPPAPHRHPGSGWR